jgi:hypothetical protein
MGNSKTVRHLLIRGADREARDETGKRPIDFIDDYKNKNSNLTKEVRQLLEDKGSFLNDCLMLRNPYKK